MNNQTLIINFFLLNLIVALKKKSLANKTDETFVIKTLIFSSQSSLFIIILSNISETSY